MLNYLKNIFTKNQNNKNGTILVSFLNDGRALFSSFGQDVYMSDYVNNCIDKIATEISKIDFVSVVSLPSTVKRQNDEITKLFKFKPNPLQTTKDFLSCCEWLRRKDCNCFIYPQYQTITDNQGNSFRYYTAFWPLAPSRIEIGVNEDGQTWEIHFYWRDGTDDIVPYADLVHLRWRRGKNTIIGGGDDFGMPNTEDLSTSLEALGIILDTMPKALQTSLKINGVYHAKTVVSDKALAATKEEFENHIRTSTTGIIATDLPGEFVPISMPATHIDDTVMKFLKGVIRERYGISEAMLSGDFTAEQHGAFYQSCIEDFITEFEQAMSQAVFTQRELDVGHMVRGYYNRTAFMTNAQKAELAQLAMNTALLTQNQVLDMYGFEPTPGGDRRLQSLNYVNADIVDAYQMNMSKGKTTTEPKGGTKQ